VRQGQRIGTGEIPQEAAAMDPENERDAIRALPIPTVQAGFH